MSDTPQTDAQQLVHSVTGATLHCVDVEFARKLERERDEVRAELSEWKILNLWGGTPEIIHEFIKGQQMRIWECQEIEKTCEQLERELDDERVITFRKADCIEELEHERDEWRERAERLAAFVVPVPEDMADHSACAAALAEFERLKEGGE
jgi:hypothetical protein